MKTDIKDTLEMIAVNGTGIGISLTDIDSVFIIYSHFFFK